jgi:transcription antitermination factor NusB
LRTQTLARELALQALYQHDLLGNRPIEALRTFCRQSAKGEVAGLALQLVAGCIENQPALDEVIRQTAENWELERMATSDRNILRLGVYELMFRKETPPKVAINEAIELAKKFSTENSPAFINGVLDRIYSEHVGGETKENRSDGNGSGAAPARRAPVGAEERPDPQGRVDLHVHSTASDGSLEPGQLPALAAKLGLRALALTDHDSVEGVGAASEAASAAGVELIPGVELTGYAPAPNGGPDLELHVAGLLLDATCEELLERLRGLRESRVERVRLICARLRELGLPVEAADVLRRSHDGAVGRLHVAQELVERGLCVSISDAFDRYLGRGAAAYVPKEKMTPAEAIALVRAAGGCSVLCHPAVSPGAEQHLEELVEAGLDALEVHYPMHTPQDEKRLMELAQTCDLVVTGGSDFHGDAKPNIHLGQEAVSLVELDRLRRRAVVGS